MNHKTIRNLIMSGVEALITSLCVLLLSEDMIPSIIVFVILYAVFMIDRERHKEEKQDRGFVWNYHKLSKRRQFIRNLWLLPFIILAMVILWMLLSVEVWRKMTVTLILLVAYVIQITSSYQRWKR